jgi:hypothetical protein
VWISLCYPRPLFYFIKSGLWEGWAKFSTPPRILKDRYNLVAAEKLTEK